MNRLLTTALVFSFGTALTVAPSFGQNKDPNSDAMSNSNTTSTKMSKMSANERGDSAFIKKAERSDLAEVELGKIAAEKASNQDVKKFGQRMVDDHSKNSDQLRQVAAKEHIELPTEPNAKQKAAIARLQKLSGDQFDRAYMRDMVMEHKRDVAEVARESKSAKDPEVKNFAAQTLPTLREHLKRAEQIAPKATGGTQGSGQ